MIDATIAFVGGGNMARSLIGGLTTAGVNPARIWVADPDTRKLEPLGAQFNVNTTQDNDTACAGADVVVLAVKPQIMQEVALSLAPVVGQRRPLVVSIAAGIRATDLARWLGEDVALVRTMPNTPALVQSGATALFANPVASSQQRDLAESILRAVGMTIWVEREELMDVVTALSGSGPAYFLLVMEVLEKAAVAQGLAQETARLLALETAFGTAKLALESPEGAAALRQRVTSPGGTTEQAIKVLQEGGLEELFARAVAAARRRSEELADELGADR